MCMIFVVYVAYRCQSLIAAILCTNTYLLHCGCDRSGGRHRRGQGADHGFVAQLHANTGVHVHNGVMRLLPVLSALQRAPSVLL